MHHEEEEGGTGGAEDRAQQIGTDRVLAERYERGPDVRDQDEERSAGRMGNPEGAGGRDELTRVPEGDRRRQRDCVDREDRGEDRQGGPIRRGDGLQTAACSVTGAAAAGPASRFRTCSGLISRSNRPRRASDTVAVSSETTNTSASVSSDNPTAAR